MKRNPAPLTSFIGRQPELAEISSALEKTRLLTLTGVGGCGKTRLALELAERWAEHFVEGVYWADLAAVMEAELVSQTVAKMFPLREMPNQTAAERITRFIKKKRILLVMDNFEQVIAACARLANDLLEACPNINPTASRNPCR